MSNATLNGEKFQGEQTVHTDTDFVGCDFEHTNIHIINGANVHFIGCVFMDVTIHGMPSKEFKSSIPCYVEQFQLSGGDKQYNYQQPVPNAPLPSTLPSTPPDASVVTQLMEVFGEFPLVLCPHRDGELPLDQAIIYLNDRAEWSREQIADWLETLDIDLTVKPKGD